MRKRLLFHIWVYQNSLNYTTNKTKQKQSSKTPITKFQKEMDQYMYQIWLNVTFLQMEGVQYRVNIWVR